MATPSTPRGEEVTAIMEILTQEYFEKIGQQLGANWIIYKADAAIIRSLIGVVTFRTEFVPYMESQGYVVEQP